MAEERPRPIRAKVLWDGVLATTSIIRGFEIRTDKPKGYWGTNTAPAPGEVFIASLAAAMLQSVVQTGRSARAEIGDVAVDARAPLTVEEGGEKIGELVLTIRVWRSAEPGAPSKERVVEIVRKAEAECGLLRTVTFPVRVDVDVREHAGRDAA